MSKVKEDQKHVEATPEQVKEYQRLKARNEWIQMNQKYLDEIERKRLFINRTLLILMCLNILSNVMVILLTLKII